MQKCFTENPEVYGEYLQAFEGEDDTDGAFGRTEARKGQSNKFGTD